MTFREWWQGKRYKAPRGKSANSYARCEQAWMDAQRPLLAALESAPQPYGGTGDSRAEDYSAWYNGPRATALKAAKPKGGA